MLAKIKYESVEGKSFDTREEAVVASIIEKSGAYIESWKFSALIEAFIKHAYIIERNIENEAIATCKSSNECQTESQHTTIRPTQDRQDSPSGNSSEDS